MTERDHRHNQQQIAIHPFASRLAASNKNDNNGGQVSKKPRWYTCCSTRELIQAVHIFVDKTHVVAELGAQLRDVSISISKHCHSAVLVDVERKFPTDDKHRTSAMRQRPPDYNNNNNDSDDNNNAPMQQQQLVLRDGVVFAEMPSLMDWRKALFFQNIQAGPYDVLVIDVSAIVGNDLEWTTFALIQEFMGLNEAFGGSCHTVLVKSAGLNRLASCLVHGQVWIDRGSSRHAGPHIVATVGVQEYRRTMERAVQAGDAVLEVGCHFGTSSVLLHEQADHEMGGYCIGVDVGSSIIERAKILHRGVYFHVGDAWKTAELLRIQESYLELHPESNPRRGFDVVYVDVGGLSGEDGVLEAIMLLGALEQALEPRCLVIKSKCMRRLSSTMIPFWQSPERREYDRKRKEEKRKATCSDS